MAGTIRGSAKLQQRSRAEEVVQEALLRVHQALEKGEQIKSPLALEIADGQITSIDSIVNSDKLTLLGPLTDFTLLLRSR
jgi:hypothetical protein